jgi:prolyl oligopeptidase
MRSLLSIAAMLTACGSSPSPSPATPTPSIVTQPAREVASPPAPPAAAGPPATRTVDVIDHQFGVDTPDPYRWMEGADNPEYKTWLTAQGAWTRDELAKIAGRDALLARVRELGLGISAVGGVQVANGRTIYTTTPENAKLPKLATRDRGTERILIDPELVGGDRHTSLNAYRLSPDGKYVGYVIATGGGEVGQIHVMDVATGKDLGDVIDSIWGEFAPRWLPDSKSFFYTQMTPPPAGGDPLQNMIARHHVLGMPTTADVTVIGRDAESTFPIPPQAFPFVSIDPTSSWVTAVAASAGAVYRVAVARLSEVDLSGRGRTPWKLVATEPDGVTDVITHGERLYAVTFKGAPNHRLISTPLAAPDLAHARIEVAEDPAADLDDVMAARDGLYLVHNAGGLARLSRWAWSGKPAPIALPGDGWIPALVGDVRRDGVTFSLDTWYRPSAYYAYDPATRQSSPTGLASRSKFVDDRLVATEVEVASADGAMVPLSILHFKGATLDGSHPTIVNGYGGYGTSLHAGFSAARLAWLERGGVQAICHVRGGGEKGRAWQDDGAKTKKLNGIRDVIACGEYLVAQHYTTPARLGIVGGSMGGILMGRALVERPDLFAAAHIAVGVTNPLRMLEAENGANQISELGDPRIEADYRSIRLFDPYVNVKDGTAYPAVIFTIGVNDHRVAPWMTGKMAARLRAATTSTRPIMIRVDGDAGHGVGSTREQSLATTADVWSFFLQQLGAAGR